MLTPLCNLQIAEHSLRLLQVKNDGLQPKKFILQLEFVTEIFIARLPSLHDVKPKTQLERCAPYCAIGNWQRGA